MSSTHIVPGLKRFLFAAKQATYAAQAGAAHAAPLLPDSRQLEHTDGEFFYRDIYVGMFQFAGQEIVYLSGRAVWSMSYSGGLCANLDTTSARSAYAFLRKALRAVSPELPLRGPSLLEENATRYSCLCTGTVERFNGVEAVTEGDVRLYDLHFSGGLLA